jgi:hypothetical protein
VAGDRRCTATPITTHSNRAYENASTTNYSLTVTSYAASHTNLILVMRKAASCLCEMSTACIQTARDVQAGPVTLAKILC